LSSSFIEDGSPLVGSGIHDPSGRNHFHKQEIRLQRLRQLVTQLNERNGFASFATFGALVESDSNNDYL